MDDNMMKSLPLVPDRSIVVACIRACVWASVEGRQFSVLRDNRPRRLHVACQAPVFL